MKLPEYEVECTDPGKVWAILRTGPTGGIKFISAYDNEGAASAMADRLNRNAHMEI